MRTYTAQLVIKEKGTTNKVKLKAKRLSQAAADELQELFVQELITDPNRLAREELTEGIDLAKSDLADSVDVSNPPGGI